MGLGSPFSTEASMEQQRALYAAEQARLADELVRRRRRAAAENEAWSLEVEMAGTEAFATQQLSEIARHSFPIMGLVVLWDSTWDWEIDRRPPTRREP